MTNDETRMTRVRNSNDDHPPVMATATIENSRLQPTASTFVIRASSFFRHSDFVIRHFVLLFFFGVERFEHAVEGQLELFRRLISAGLDRRFDLRQPLLADSGRAAGIVK